MGLTTSPGATDDTQTTRCATGTAAEALLPASSGSVCRSTGRATTGRLGFVQVSAVSGPAQSLVLSPTADIRAPSVVVGVHTRGRARLVRGNGDDLCAPGDLFVRDGSEPLVLHEAEDFELHVVRIPRRALALTDPQVRDLLGRGPRSDGTVAPLLVSVLRTLPRTVTDCSPRTALHLAGNVTELLAALAVEETETRPPDSHRDRAALTRRLCAHIDEHLWHRDLSPAAVAAAHHISIRYLHKLFSAHGSTVGRWIQHRRLEEARRELARPGRGTTGVAAVAARWGFVGAAHFSRSFRQAYGMSPSDWRDSRTAPPSSSAG
ncbi:AraC family transcriptional regulator [Streptomyces sp. NPDC052309]|uniref:AraC family transcriptional regulator n=1 Tax=Streptomyces sp. NPDC052309 TaxID=3155421 RepID=UPI003429A111